MTLDTLTEAWYKTGKEQSPMYVFGLAAGFLIEVANTAPQPFDILFAILSSTALVCSALSGIHYITKVWGKA